MERDTPWLRPDSVTKQELNRIASKISQKKGRNVQFSSYTEDVAVLDHSVNKVDALILYQEIKSKVTSERPMIHQHTVQSAAYQSLFHWHKFNETLEPFLSPIRFLLKCRSSPHATSRSKELRVTVQDKLIESHFNTETITTLDLIEPIEIILNATLIKVLVFRELACFFFEWESEPFIFLMAFTISLSGKAYQLAKDTVVTLYRENLMQFDEEVEETTAGRSNLLQSLMSENEDSEEEMIVETKLKYLTSSNIEQEDVLKPFIKSVQEAYISYQHALYVKI